MKVLIGVDGSECGFAAVQMAGGLLDASRDQVAMYCSLPEKFLKRNVNEDVRKRTQAALVEAVMDEAIDRLPESLRQSATRIAGDKPPAAGLLEAADEWQADLIVVGARGLGKLTSLLVGSVSRAVAQRAKVSVLVVRGDHNDGPPKAMKILVASEPEGNIPQVAHLLNRLRWPDGAVGKIVTVIESLQVGEIPAWLSARVKDPELQDLTKVWDDEHEQERAAATESMRRLASDLPGAFRGGEPILCEGPTADRILETIARERPDLVVVGSHRRGRMERFLIGSTSEKILSHAPSSVLIVREA